MDTTESYKISQFTSHKYSPKLLNILNNIVYQIELYETSEDILFVFIK